MRRLLEEQDTVFGCYYTAKWGNKAGQSGGGEEAGQRHIGTDVYVQRGGGGGGGDGAEGVCVEGEGGGEMCSQ